MRTRLKWHGSCYSDMPDQAEICSTEPNSLHSFTVTHISFNMQKPPSWLLSPSKLHLEHNATVQKLQDFISPCLALILSHKHLLQACSHILV